jgi:hypothetical protein
MTGRQFNDWQTAGGDDDVSLLVPTLEGLKIPWCMLCGQLAAYADTQRRPSKRQKDLVDIARLIENQPALRTQVPAAILKKLSD